MRTQPIHALILIVLAAPCLAQPVIGVHFDPEGTRLQTQLDIADMGQAHVLVKHADMLLAGAAFRLEIDGEPVIGNVVSAPGVVFGDLESGFEIGFYQSAPQFGADPVSLVDFTYFALSRTQARFTVLAHPDYATPVVASSDALIHPAEGLMSVAEIRERPEIGIWFDADCNEDYLHLNPPVFDLVQTWICVRGAQALINGAAFRLEFDAPLTLQSPQPGEGLVIGDLENGVEIGLYNPVPVFDDVTALLFNPAFLLVADDGRMNLRILPHPDYATPVVADNAALILEASGGAAVLQVGGLSSEPMTWGRVKSLYR